MRRVFFGELREGRLARMPFLAWTILLMLLVIGFGLLFGAALGVAGTAVGDEADVEAAIEALFSGPLLVLLTLIGLVILFVHYNLIAKRARDIGLPGWWTVAAVFLLSGFAGALLSETAVGLINGAIGLALLLLPGDLLRRPRTA
ncbi:MAG TPA: DUF805 domain-containing protein [Geminicoccaceae bacterium]